MTEKHNMTIFLTEESCKFTLLTECLASRMLKPFLANQWGTNCGSLQGKLYKMHGLKSS